MSAAGNGLEASRTGESCFAESSVLACFFSGDVQVAGGTRHPSCFSGESQRQKGWMEI